MKVFDLSQKDGTNGVGKSKSNWLTQSTVIGTLAVDGQAVTFGTARRGLGKCTGKSNSNWLTQVHLENGR